MDFLERSGSPTGLPPTVSLAAIQEITKVSKCALCNCYLSVPPISIISHDGMSQKCGRCKSIKTKVDQRNIPFENVMKHVKFPCQFRNCKMKTAWGNVEDHEKVCPHRTINCPLNWDCDMAVPIRELTNHFKAKHEGNLCYENYIDEEFKFGYHTSVLLMKDELPFLIWCRSDPSKNNFEVSAFSFSTNHKYKYEMTLLKKSSKSSMKASLRFTGEVIDFDERCHCIKCTLGACKDKHHKYSTLYSNTYPSLSTTTIIDCSGVKKTLKSDVYYCLITMKREHGPHKRQLSEDIRAEDTSGNNEKLIRQILQCPICMDYMSAPIFTCKVGHKICSVCKQKVFKCPSCNDVFQNARNFDLEEMAEGVELSCKYKSTGCNFTANVMKILRHQETTCEFKK